MNLTDPAPLTDVIKSLGDKSVIGAKLRTADWERLPQEIRDRSFFSAGIESVRWLGEAQKRIGDIVKRTTEKNAKGESFWSADRAKVIAELRVLGKQLGIEHPDGPRPGGKIREHDLTDPLSIRRLKLIVDTQLEMAYGYGEYLAANDPAVLVVWPCWELVRIRSRKVPRNWRKRWSDAGGKFYGTRMIALKSDPIWIGISRFRNPYPPFDFNSGMGVADVTRGDALALGVIQPDEKRVTNQPIRPQDFNHNLSATLKDMEPVQRQILAETFGDRIEIIDDTVRWRGDEPAKKALDEPPPKADNEPHVPSADSPPTSPPLPPRSGDRQDGGAQTSDPVAIREAVEGVFRGAFGESYPELHAPHGGFQKGVEAQITAASLGWKPLYYDPWPEGLSESLAGALKPVLPTGTEIRTHEGNLFVYRPEALQPIIAADPAFYGPDLWQAILKTTPFENGELLGYGARNTSDRPASQVTLFDAEIKPFVRFWTRPETLEEIAAARIKDLMLTLPEMDFDWIHKLFP